MNYGTREGTCPSPESTLDHLLNPALRCIFTGYCLSKDFGGSLLLWTTISHLASWSPLSPRNCARLGPQHVCMSIFWSFIVQPWLPDGARGTHRSACGRSDTVLLKVCCRIPDAEWGGWHKRGGISSEMGLRSDMLVAQGVYVISSELHQLAEILQQSDHGLGPCRPVWVTDSVGWNVCRNTDNLHINKFGCQRSQIKNRSMAILFLPLGKRLVFFLSWKNSDVLLSSALVVSEQS